MLLNSKKQLKLQTLMSHVVQHHCSQVESILISDAKFSDLLIFKTSFQDLSGRCFNCTAYEYAFWANDWRMLTILEKYMTPKIKSTLFLKIKEIKKFGLFYQKGKEVFQNPAYGKCFIFKNLLAEEFIFLKRHLGAIFSRVESLDILNYKFASFSYSEFEAIQQGLLKKSKSILYIFSQHRWQSMMSKIQFDFKLLSFELRLFIDHFSQLNEQQRTQQWKSIQLTKSQLPACIVHNFLKYTGEENEKLIHREMKKFLKENSWNSIFINSAGAGINFELLKNFHLANSFENCHACPKPLVSWCHQWESLSKLYHFSLKNQI